MSGYKRQRQHPALCPGRPCSCECQSHSGRLCSTSAVRVPVRARTRVTRCVSVSVGMDGDARKDRLTSKSSLIQEKEAMPAQSLLLSFRA